MRRVIALAAALALATAGSAQGAVPESQQAALWERACTAVGGVVLTPAINCVHFNAALGDQWSANQLKRLRHVCEGPLGGEFAIRTPFPDEVAACFS